MDVDDGGTSWTATLRFTRESGRSLVAIGQIAAKSGASVLVMDRERRVLLAVPVPQADGATVTFEGLEKPDAWHLVEQFARS